MRSCRPGDTRGDDTQAVEKSRRARTKVGGSRERTHSGRENDEKFLFGCIVATSTSCTVKPLKVCNSSGEKRAIKDGIIDVDKGG